MRINSCISLASSGATTQTHALAQLVGGCGDLRRDGEGWEGNKLLSPPMDFSTASAVLTWGGGREQRREEDTVVPSNGRTESPGGGGDSVLLNGKYRVCLGLHGYHAGLESERAETGELCLVQARLCSHPSLSPSLRLCGVLVPA